MQLELSQRSKRKDLLTHLIKALEGRQKGERRKYIFEIAEPN
jgi:hypothetical protein